jgi:hypothetical protein
MMVAPAESAMVNQLTTAGPPTVNRAIVSILESCQDRRTDWMMEKSAWDR